MKQYLGIHENGFSSSSCVGLAFCRLDRGEPRNGDKLKRCEIEVDMRRRLGVVGFEGGRCPKLEVRAGVNRGRRVGKVARLASGTMRGSDW